MQSKRYLIVGAGAAGMAAAGVVSELDPGGSITLLSAEPDPPYYRPMIPLLVSRQRSDEQIALAGREPFRSTSAADLRLGVRAARVDTGARQLFAEGGAAFDYDRLLIASGSRPLLLEGVEGMSAEGVTRLRTLADARQMAERARTAGQAVVLGAGLQGVKAALALRHCGLSVALVEREAEILPAIMEADAGALIRAQLQRSEIDVITGATISAVQTDGQGVCGAELDNGKRLPCRLLCISTGVAPDTAFLQQSNIHCDQGGGVITDRYTACSAPDVYAAGDVAMTHSAITGAPVLTALWTSAVEMGRCAGANMAGRPTVYPGALGILNASRVGDTPFISMGLVHTSGTEYETHVSRKPGAYRKLVFTPEGDRLLGALFIGDISRAGLYGSLIRSGSPIAGVKKQLVDHRLHYGHLLPVTTL